MTQDPDTAYPRSSLWFHLRVQNVLIILLMAPTILEAAGLPEPTMVPAVAYGGHEHAYSFNEADAPDRHDLQYFEMFANLPVASRSG